MTGIFILISSIGLYLNKNIIGAIRFSDYCKKEYGLKLYKKADAGGIWIADEKWSAKVIASLEGVAFSRYLDTATGRWFDVHFESGPKDRSESYSSNPADMTLQPRYGIRTLRGTEVPGELRLTKSGYELYRLADEGLIATFYGFGFFFFDPSKVPLSSPAPRQCVRDFDGYKALQKAIAN